MVVHPNCAFCDFLPQKRTYHPTAVLGRASSDTQDWAGWHLHGPSARPSFWLAWGCLHEETHSGHVWGTRPTGSR